MSKCELKCALDGNMVPVVSKDGRTFRLGSWYNGRYAAERWIDYHVTDGVENVIFFGLGDCQIVRLLLRRIPGYVLVYEPDAAIFHEVRQSVLFSKFRKEEKLYILYGDNQEIPLRDVITDILNADCVETTAVMVHPGYLPHYEKKCQQLRDICTMVCDRIGFVQGALPRFMKAMVSNQLDNIPFLKNGIPVARLQKYWDPEIPVVMIGAGPSLKKNVGLLKKIDKRAFVFCTDSALPTVLRSGFTPDLVATTDALKNLNCFSEEGSFDIPYMLTSNSRHDVVAKLTNRKIWAYDHLGIRVLFERQGIEVPQIPSQFGIAAGIFAMLTELGTKTIIMIGQDLAYSGDNESHIDGRDESYPEDQISETEGYYGGTVKTRLDWQTFREWFEEMIAMLPQDRKVINATEGGAKIQGAVQMSLSEVIASLPEKRIDFQDVLGDERVKITDKEYKGIMKDYARFPLELEKIRKQGYHKTFFETNFWAMPVMDLIVGYMRYLKDVPDRKKRFHMALDYISGEVEKRNKEMDD